MVAPALVNNADAGATVYIIGTHIEIHSSKLDC